MATTIAQAQVEVNLDTSKVDMQVNALEAKLRARTARMNSTINPSVGSLSPLSRLGVGGARAGASGIGSEVAGITAASTAMRSLTNHSGEFRKILKESNKELVKFGKEATGISNGPLKMLIGLSGASAAGGAIGSFISNFISNKGNIVPVGQGVVWRDKADYAYRLAQSGRTPGMEGLSAFWNGQNNLSKLLQNPARSELQQKIFQGMLDKGPSGVSYMRAQGMRMGFSATGGGAPIAGSALTALGVGSLVLELTQVFKGIKDAFNELPYDKMHGFGRFIKDTGDVLKGAGREMQFWGASIVGSASRDEIEKRRIAQENQQYIPMEDRTARLKMLRQTSRGFAGLAERESIYKTPETQAMFIPGDVISAKKLKDATQRDIGRLQVERVKYESNKFTELKQQNQEKQLRLLEDSRLANLPKEFQPAEKSRIDRARDQRATDKELADAQRDLIKAGIDKTINTLERQLSISQHVYDLRKDASEKIGKLQSRTGKWTGEMVAPEELRNLFLRGQIEEINRQVEIQIEIKDILREMNKTLEEIKDSNKGIEVADVATTETLVTAAQGTYSTPTF